MKVIFGRFVDGITESVVNEWETSEKTREEMFELFLYDPDLDVGMITCSPLEKEFLEEKMTVSRS